MANSPTKKTSWLEDKVRRLTGGGAFWRSTAGKGVVGVAFVALLLAGWSYAWRTWGEPTATGEEYTVTPEKIELNPAPDWIQADIKSEVVRAGGLSSLPLRDPQLVDKVSRAFAMHNWIAKVQRVTKSYPAKVVVEVEYRRPVAMVEVTWHGEPKLYFIDAESVLLPSEDFEREIEQKVPHYLRITAGDVAPAGRSYGLPWGNDRIAGAAKIADHWQNQWKPLGLYRILISIDPNAQPLYELATAKGTKVLWGHAPGSETPGEQTAREKVVWLEQYVAKHGPLDKSATQDQIDLRTTSGKAPPQTARKNGPAKR